MTDISSPKSAPAKGQASVSEMARRHSSDTKTLVLFGGSFDPVHNGHLSAALDARAQLKAASVSLLPCHLPPHKATLQATGEQRLQMLRLAIAGTPELVVDPWELEQDSPSYTFATLTHYRQVYGPEACLIFLMGWDSLQTIMSWYRWQELERLANFAVWPRPGYSCLSGEVQAWVDQRQVAAGELQQYCAGKLAFLQTAPVAISSSAIRDGIAVGSAIENAELDANTSRGDDNNARLKTLIPAAVWDYIKLNQLYLNTL